MKISVFGVNHKTADVDVRERLAFNGPKLEEGLLKIKSITGINEAVILSTCNRVEIYTNSKAASNAHETVKNFLSDYQSIEREKLDKSLYAHENSNAIKHIFRVASSLDSMVVGEPQILGQLKDAFDFALSKKTTGVLINKLMKKAISVAKRIRTETRIAENAVSISFSAVELAKKIFTDLSTKTVVLLGAGEMAELAAKHLVKSGVKEVLIANRTYDRGCELAKEFNGRPIKFENLIEELVNTDIVICSTGASSYVITKSQIQKVMKERRQQPVFLIDISVPRNIDPEINEIDNVYLYDIDDLQGVVDTNMLGRKKEAEKAEMIIDEEVDKFLKWQSSLDAVPTIIALREKADAIKNDEILKIFNKIPELGTKEREAIECLASSILNKLIHPPTAALKEDCEDREVLIATIKKLYELN
ncbi:MAG: glutamyl-tRNA reductase [Nitrospiraceae bacterium]|nr:glutamyl-tRNA reductase [Nitrospiraceae bacterium]